MRNSEDDLVVSTESSICSLEVVVCAEQLSEVSVEVVLTYEILADSSTVSVTILAYVNLSVEVQLSKNHLNEALVATAVYVSTLSCEVIALDKLLTLILNPCEEVSTVDLLRTNSTYCIVLSCERYVTEHVDSVVVRQSTQCASLSDESALILELNACRVVVHLADELVAKAYLIENTVVHSNDKLVRCLPVHVVHVGQTSIVPAASSLISSQALEVEVSTEVLTETTVNTTNIGTTISTIRR